MDLKFKIAILQNGLSQRDLARKTGIPEAYLSMAINGKFNLDPVQRGKIIKAIGKPENEIFESN